MQQNIRLFFKAADESIEKRKALLDTFPEPAGQ